MVVILFPANVRRNSIMGGTHRVRDIVRNLAVGPKRRNAPAAAAHPQFSFTDKCKVRCVCSHNFIRIALEIETTVM
jgi:hypothetical protein